MDLKINQEENHDTQSVCHDTSTTTNMRFAYGGLEVLGEREYFNGETLSQGVQRIFGFDISAKITEEESRIIGSNKRLLNLIGGQRIFHVLGLMKEFNVPQVKLYGLKNILVRRDILKSVRWVGKAKTTLGMILYLTKNCEESDVRDYLIDYNEQDLLRLEKQIQRSKKTKTKEEMKEIWKDQKDAANELRIESIPEPEVCEHGANPSKCLVISCLRKR